MKKNTCKHESTTRGDPRAYTRSVSVHPYTDENPMAHGGIEQTEKCEDCGATRLRVSNGRHEEYGPWSSDRR